MMEKFNQDKAKIVENLLKIKSYINKEVYYEAKEQFINDMPDAIKGLEALEPTVKVLEWYQEAGYFVAHVSNELRYKIYLRTMDVYFYTYHSDIWHKDLNAEYDKSGVESPLNYCKRICQDDYEKLILGALQ